MGERGWDDAPAFYYILMTPSKRGGGECQQMAGHSDARWDVDAIIVQRSKLNEDKLHKSMCIYQYVDQHFGYYRNTINDPSQRTHGTYCWTLGTWLQTICQTMMRKVSLEFLQICHRFVFSNGVNMNLPLQIIVTRMISFVFFVCPQERGRSL